MPNRGAWKRADEWLSRILPERRIILHSASKTRDIRVGSGTQAMAMTMTALVAGWMSLSTATMVAPSPKDAELAAMQAQIAAMKADTAALQGTVATTAERIEARQQFLAGLLTGKTRPDALANMLPRLGRGKTAIDPSQAGVLKPFAELEAAQLAFVDKAAATAETRLRDAEALLARLGLNADRFVAQSSFAARGRLGMGGPYVPATGGADPRFADLFVNWQRVSQLEDAMTALPSFMPVASFSYTSGFGFRYDPFHGGAANHQGVDMAGAHGEPIRASAGGTVVRAGWFGAYGNTIDIDHGRGIMTRYAHLSRIRAQVGDRVNVGETIGAMGSTGRSTGTHLHFEVHVDGRQVNPRPFLDATGFVLAMQQSRVGPQLADAQ
ncbi:M23 family metallopeptidase [Sandaracinobacteroides saxicola]|nr:peptidoglycan DD-metalloendopeptidase family protein [Sandaracinobacteroides saxicola]